MAILATFASAVLAPQTAAGAAEVVAEVPAPISADGLQPEGQPSAAQIVAFDPGAESAAAVTSAELAVAADAVRQFALAQGLSGWINASLRPEEELAVIHWQGEPPTELTEFVDTLTSPGVAVRIESTSQTRDELREIARQLSLLPGVVSAGPNSDYTGLSVTTTDSGAASLARTRSAVPVEVDVVEEDAKGEGWRTLARQNDAPPFSGGTWMQNGQSSCSAGFSMRTSSGSEAMTTAEHCSTPGRPTWRGAVSNALVYGTELRKDARTDSMLISGQDYFRDPFVGEFICDSGGLSGEVCAARVTGSDQFIDGLGHGFITDVSGTFNYGSAGEGDSGGPAYGNNPNGTGVAALGLIVAGLELSEANCAPGAVPAAGRLCFLVIFHTNIVDVGAALLARPQTIAP